MTRQDEVEGKVTKITVEGKDFLMEIQLFSKPPANTVGKVDFKFFLR